jgi:DNA gyrase/topoisomerase IV subunit B
MKTDEFKILDDISHILLRPAIYIGSVVTEEKKLFLNYNYTTVNYNPGLFKVINELIDNSVDEYVRTLGKFANKIELTISDNEFSIMDNGRGIPVDKVLDTDGKMIYRPEAAWCRTKAGSNFNDDAERITAGMNGVGAALSNIYSKRFVGETSDGTNKFTVICNDNAKIESVKVVKSTKKYTKVTMQPDFARFGETSFDSIMKALIEDRLHGLAIAFPKITFICNGNTIKAETAKNYVSKFGSSAVVYSDAKVILGFMPSVDGDLRYHSVVNGLTLYSGGTHIDYIMNSVVSTLREAIKKKHKFDIVPSQIKAHIQLISVIRDFKNAKFDSQTKEKLKNSNAEVAEYLSYIDYEMLAKQIMKDDSIILPIIETQLAKQALNDKRNEQDKNKKLKGKKVAKHLPATSTFVEQKSLFIMEGDSAVGPFASVRNAKTQGAIPLRGKVLNTFGKSNIKILENVVMSELMVVLGLELGKPPRGLTYGTIVIMTDQDVDGASIRVALINFFYNWPELFEKNRVKILNSPRYILRSKKQRHYFYDSLELEKYKGSRVGYDLAYIKGLGTLRLEEYRDVISDPYYETVTIDDPELFSMMYSEDTAPRKTFMLGNV